MANCKEELKKIFGGIESYIIAQIENNDAFADKVVRDRVKDNRDIYKTQLGLTDGARPDFKDVVTQWAYIYSYFLYHVHLVDSALREILKEEANKRLSPKLAGINVLCSIGGGPNTDSVGLRLYLQSLGVETFPEEVHVFDKYLNWERSWHTLRGILPAEYQHEATYYEFDFLADRSMLAGVLLDVIQKADLITMIKSLSSVAANRDQTISELRRILRAMKPGGLLLFIDNNLQTQWEEIFKGADYEETHLKILDFKTIWSDELSMDDISERKTMINQLIHNYPVIKCRLNVILLIERRE